MGKRNNSYTNWQFIKDLAGLFKKRRLAFTILTSLLFTALMLELVPPLIIAAIIDLFTTDLENALPKFYYYLSGMLLVFAISATLRVYTKSHASMFAKEIKRDTKVIAFQKILEGDLVWHDKENTGNRMQKIMEGVSSIERFIRLFNNQILGFITRVFGVIVIFAFFSVKYSLIAIALVASFVAIEFYFNRKLSKYSAKIKVAKEKSIGKAYELSSNIRTVKSLGMETSSKKKIKTYEDKVVKIQRERKKLSRRKNLLINLLINAFFVLFIFLVGRDVILGVLSVGLIVVYTSYVGRLNGSLGIITMVTDTLIDIKHSIHRMMQIFNKVPDIKEDHAHSLDSWKSIRLDDLGFHYKNEPVLTSINQTIHKGDKIGIVGRSGSGKSTLFKLLLKLYLPEKGMIYFDHQPITLLKRSSIVDKYSIVPQDTEMFNMSFKENITVSNPNGFDSERYEKALRISRCDEVVKKLKKGDSTTIGEKGVRLSGGERQRLGIARAIYKNSDIIIFDESTSNLDYEIERKIQKAIDKELKDKTLIVAAHRLSTLQNMDKIIVIIKGRIVEEGTYDELLKKKSHFYKLWKKQEK